MIRIFNTILTSVLLGVAVLVSRGAIKRGFVLTWSVAAVPWLVIYASSSNPSSWVIVGTSTSWAFALAALDRGNSRAYRLIAVAGLVIATAVALAGRFDAGVWLALSLCAVIIYSTGRPRFRLGLRVWVPGVVLAIAASAFAIRLNWNRFGFRSLSLPEWNRATDQAFPLLKDVLEIPWWFASFFGMQPPTWLPSNGEPQSTRDGYIPVVLSTNLGDFFFPSAVGLLLTLAAALVVFACIPRFDARILITLFIMLLVLCSIVYLFRARYGFGPMAPLQNRYFLPWLVLVLAVALTVRGPTRPLLTRAQLITVGALLTVGGILAWLAFAGRFAVNLSGTFTNFGQEPVWWWPTGPSRLVWFLVASAATMLWVVVTLRFATRIPGEIKEPTHSRG